MRKFAAIYDNETGFWSVAFQDDDDYTPEIWYVHIQNMTTDAAIAKEVVDSLNKKEFVLQ